MPAKNRRRTGKGNGAGSRSSQFQPGQPGNRKGRPKGSKNTKTLVGRQWFLEQVNHPDFHKLVKEKIDADPQWAWEWAHGKAKQQVDVTSGDGGTFNGANVSLVLVLARELSAMQSEGLITREVRDRLRGCLPSGDPC